MSVLEWCRWLQDSPVGRGISESGHVYPLVEGSHVMGLALSIGTVLWFDLRLSGSPLRRDTVTAAIPPPRARLAGAVSLVLWFAIIAAGRIMAFNL